MLYKEEPHGVTRMSTQFLNDSLKRCFGEIVTIEGRIDKKQESWVAFCTDEGDSIVVNGFSWGYMGEGPRGLFEAAQKLGFTHLTRELISRFPREQSWKMCKYGCSSGSCFKRSGIVSLVA